ncbi:F-box DNA helicase 1 isoform X3 [Cynoglossus semilaevis]|uniref:F-box DNA helicase 1 isoform X3 n=1 Tax=Cynoglossus semilaevis TaxID=244447 RepID=UPI0004968C02|nr:F-box DNA helicase 1 isoform X3 [Cynoglossus semilaevis]
MVLGLLLPMVTTVTTLCPGVCDVQGKAKRRHLSADECQHLGHGSLTEPHVFNQRPGNSDRHRRHLPRTAPKKHKCEPQLLHHVQEEEEEEEEEDSTLFTAAMELGAEEEEEEEEGEGEAEGTVDYLQGMTSRMFDEDFDCCETKEEEVEEEVEPLPDAHYGLLGPSRTLLQPRACIDDLPEEVLRQILALLPAQDLYGGVALTCHRWREIMEDTKFVPFRKQYYRYMKRERGTVEELTSILKNSDITGPKSSEHSIRNLVVFMAQHTVGERVRPEDVLHWVRRHRLSPQAEFSVRSRLPDVQEELETPLAVMAVILVLSEGVGDVQALVSLLTRCMSLTAVTEFLSHMATILLAMERNAVHISTRLHYNIYYVLQLMENGPGHVSSRSSSSHQLTAEQQLILNHNIQNDHVVKIKAFAGTGKTTTLVKYAEQRPHLRFLYVAFNKSVANEARRRFPGNVDCRTVHSLAFRDTGQRYKSKLTTALNLFSISLVLPPGRGGYTKAKVVASTLRTFMASAEDAVNISHVPDVHTTNSGNRIVIVHSEKQLFVSDAQMIWNRMKDVRRTDREAYRMTHDGYLKLWQLQEPKPRLSDYHVLLIDEAQDCTPAIMDVLLSQPCGKILVGDPHQQIYTFRGAVNALQLLEHTHVFYLTQSFRFGAEIAYVGATILKTCKNVEKILVGGTQKGGVCDENADRVAEAVRTGEACCRGNTAILSRCNTGVFDRAVKLTDANPRCRIHFIGDVKNFGLDRIMDLWRLTQPNPHPKFIKDPLIRHFVRMDGNSVRSLKEYIDQTDDLELNAKLTIVEKYASRIPELLIQLRSCSEPDLHRADFIVGTVHKAKGLEFESVMITDDFVRVPWPRHRMYRSPAFSLDSVPGDEWNLLYVAATRAKTTLIISESIYNLLTLAGEYFLKSEPVRSVTPPQAPPPCSVSNCPNCITPGSSFVMSAPTLKCSDSVLQGGPLCERCVWNRVGPIAFLVTDDVMSMANVPERLAHGVFHV